MPENLATPIRIESSDLDQQEDKCEITNGSASIEKALASVEETLKRMRDALNAKPMQSEGRYELSKSLSLNFTSDVLRETDLNKCSGARDSQKLGLVDTLQLSPRLKVRATFPSASLEPKEDLISSSYISTEEVVNLTVRAPSPLEEERSQSSGRLLIPSDNQRIRENNDKLNSETLTSFTKLSPKIPNEERDVSVKCTRQVDNEKPYQIEMVKIVAGAALVALVATLICTLIF